MMIYGKPVARLWARCAGSGDGVIVGVALKDEGGDYLFAVIPPDQEG